MSSPPSASLDLRVVSSSADFDALAWAWSRLHDESGASVFQSYEWHRTWWAHLAGSGPDRQLHIVVLAAGTDTVGIAPLCVEGVPIAAGVRLRRLAFLGAGLSDYQDVLVRPGFEEVCCERIAAHLANGPLDFDVLSLTDLDQTSHTRGPLFVALRRHGFDGQSFVSEQCPRTLLRGTWEETLASFDRSRRRKLSSARRRLQDDFHAALEVCGMENLDADIDEFIEMHQQRWTDAGRRGIYADPAVAAFQRQVARLFSGRGWLFLPFLLLDGARVATFCGFKHRDRLYVYVTGMRAVGPARKLSPGVVLHSLCMEELIPQGVRVYDFLRGIEQYKYDCGAVDVPQWTVLMFRRGNRVAKAKHLIALLEASLARRAQQEWTAVQHLRRQHGFLSAAVAKYAWRRLAVTIRDGVRKIRAPEKSLTAPR